MLVRSFKRVLYTILVTRGLTVEVWNTAFCRVEYALNSRPLTPVSADLSNPGAITPNHFLIRNQATEVPSFVDVDEFEGLLSLWVTIQPLGLKKSDTIPTASLSPPSYAGHPDCLSDRSLSLYQSSQHLLPGRRMIPSKLKGINYIIR